MTLLFAVGGHERSVEPARRCHDDAVARIGVVPGGKVDGIYGDRRVERGDRGRLGVRTSVSGPVTDGKVKGRVARGHWARYIEIHMKQILVELDDRCARELERVAPAKKRQRAEFVRLAIRRAIDLALDRASEAAYRAAPVSGELRAADLEGWDEKNALARPAVAAKRRRARPAA